MEGGEGRRDKCKVLLMLVAVVRCFILCGCGDGSMWTDVEGTCVTFSRQCCWGGY